MARITGIISSAILLMLVASAAMAQRTTRRNLRSPQIATPVETAPLDTVECTDASSISLNGFDKPLRSAYESLFVSNRSSRPLAAIVVSIDYLDMKGRKLHSRTLTLPIEVPAGDTRQVTFRTWDRQQSFYYFRSAKPRRADGTPFDVAVRVEKLIYSK